LNIQIVYNYNGTFDTFGVLLYFFCNTGEKRWFYG